MKQVVLALFCALLCLGFAQQASFPYGTYDNIDTIVLYDINTAFRNFVYNPHNNYSNYLFLNGLNIL
jgi:hypothetical protein